MDLKEIEDEFLDDNIDAKIKPKPRKKGVNGKAKGNRGENELSKILNARFQEGLFIRNITGSGAYLGKSNRSRNEGMSAVVQEIMTADIICTQPAYGFEFSIEHKAYKEADIFEFFNEGSNINKFIHQCQEDADSIGKFGLLVIHYNNHKRICFTNKPTELEPVFIFKGWKCYWLEDFLKLPNNYFFKNFPNG